MFRSKLFLSGEKNMKLATDINDKIKLATIEEKAKRLCKIYKCDVMDLIVLSITVQAQINKNKIKLK